MTKMHHRRKGPFRIARVVADGKAYAVSVPCGHTMVGVTLSVDKLSLYSPRAQWGPDKVRTERAANPVPVAILGHYQRPGEKRVYLVRYRGHHSGLDQFVTGLDLPIQLIRDYLRSGQMVQLDPA